MHPEDPEAHQPLAVPAAVQAHGRVKAWAAGRRAWAHDWSDETR